MADVFVCASSLHGHVTPMLEIATHLHAAGHTVRMTTGSRFRDRVEAAGVEFIPLTGAADIDDTDLDRAFPDRARATGIAKVKFDVSHLFIGAMRTQWAILSAELERRPADVVLYETAFIGVGPLLAGSAPRPPVIGCGVIPLTLSSPHVPPFGPALRYAAGPVGRLRNRALGTVISKVVMARQQSEAQAAIADCVPGARLTGYFMDGLRHADTFLVLSVPSLDYPRPDLPPHIDYIGPVLPRSAGPADLPDWWAELDGTRPVVLVTQGTLDVMDLDRLLGPALRGLSDEDVLVVAATGGPPVERLGPLPQNARAATFLPFDLLMPKVSAMVTNGGFGGVHFALAHGVPLVVAGDTEDKPEIAARVHWSGAGTDLRTGTPTPDRVRSAVRTVLSEHSYRERARLVGEDIRRSDALGRITAEVEARSTDARP
jgi:UDP:flavonoid glycosyltransferase YjiC (YdhE family)